MILWAVCVTLWDMGVCCYADLRCLLGFGCCLIGYVVFGGFLWLLVFV